MEPFQVMFHLLSSQSPYPFTQLLPEFAFPKLEILSVESDPVAFLLLKNTLSQFTAFIVKNVIYQMRAALSPDSQSLISITLYRYTYLSIQ